MRILLIEDEPLVAKELSAMLLRVEPKAEVIGILPGVAVAMKWFSENTPPDLIVSDIQLSDGISFEIFEKLHLHCPIIFATAYDEYAIRAFKLNSIDYLLKPFDPKELESALLKYKSLAGDSPLSEQLRQMLGEWREGVHRKYKERFLSLHRNMLVPVTVDQIMVFRKEELIYLLTTDNERYISDHQALEEIESLVDPALFFRVNRQHIIHIQAVGKIKTTHKGLTVQLKPPLNLDLDVSREKAAAFKNWIG